MQREDHGDSARLLRAGARSRPTLGPGERRERPRQFGRAVKSPSPAVTQLRLGGPGVKKVLRIAGFLVLAVLVLYFVGVNALLASPLGERLFTSEPELFQIRYERAWTLWPGSLHVKGFQLSTQDRAVQVMITADRVQGDLHLWTLWELRFFATDVEADGVTMHVRPRVKEGDERKAHLDELPPIAGYASPIITQAELDEPRGPLVKLEFKNLVVHHLREVWIERLRYNGDAEVTGGMLYEPFQKLRLDDVHVVDSGAKLAQSVNAVAIERLEVQASLKELSLAKPKVADFQKLTCDLKLEATLEPSFLNGYLTNVKGLSTLKASGKDGPLALALQVKDGVVADGASLSFTTPHAAVRIPFVELSGAAEVKGKSHHGKLALDLGISRVRLKQHDGERLAEANRFALLASSAADLTKVDSVDAHLVLRGGRVPSLTALNQFIPSGAGVRVTDGKGEVEGELWLDSASARGKGGLTVTAKSVSVKNRSAMLTGRLEVKGVVRSLDLDTNALDLSGSEVAIQDATLTNGQRYPFWFRAHAEPCVLTPKAKVRWSTTLSLGASNLQPLLAIVAENLSIPKVLTAFTSSPNVRVEAELTVRRDGIDLPRLILTSSRIRAQGSMSLRPVSEQDEKLQPWGHAKVQAGVFSAGLEFRGARVSPVLFGVERWAREKQLTH